MRSLLVVLSLLMLAPPDARADATGDVSRVVRALESLTRFARVDERLYRGGQPDAGEFARLRELGVRTVISLRSESAGSAEKQIVESLGMSFVHIPVTMHAFGLSGDVPTAAVKRFFEVVDDPSSGTVFVHCRRGADRTGTFVALYRIARQGWSPEKAYDEARASGMRWWHYSVRGLLRGFAETLTREPSLAMAPAQAR
jgi:protein tyrosine phosphatase (PTP) superfamily phosphohydrolase (DUF442 family)